MYNENVAHYTVEYYLAARKNKICKYVRAFNPSTGDAEAGGAM